jgi:hypothetical protein
MTLRDGREVAVVSDEAFLGALLEVGRMVCFAGGTISAAVLRHPTDFPGEMVTVGASVEWKDRTDAREQPEPAVRLTDEAQAALDAEEERDFITGNADGAEEGQGSAALPFQREEQRAVDADAALAQVDAALNGAPTPAPEIAREHQIAPRVELQEAIVHEEGSSYRPVEPPKGASEEGIDDGFVATAEEDLSEIPESLR